MYRQAVDHLEPGAVLAAAVQDASGMTLLAAGTRLTPELLRALRRRGIPAVYLRDGLADDLAPEDMISPEVRQTVGRQVERAFDRVLTVAADRGAGATSVTSAVESLGEEPLPLGAGGDDEVARLYGAVESIIAEILERSTVTGLESLKGHNEYTFQHSVDVAVVGVLLGKTLGMHGDRLRELALGCLLHDIGKLYIEESILDKPGPLTPEEFDAVREHPRMGFELVRRMPCHSLLPAHVAYQHHEQQGGAGYPRGLVGRNRLGGRAAREEIGAGHMLLIAEIAAVADVYSALSSDRPYRPAMLPDRVAEIMRGMAGRHLNREVLRALQRVTPPYPVGSWVECDGAGLTGCRGVVSHVPPVAVDRPVVRLLLDERGESLASPFEVATRDHEDLSLACVVGHRDLVTAG